MPTTDRFSDELQTHSRIGPLWTTFKRLPPLRGDQPPKFTHRFCGRGYSLRTAGDWMLVAIALVRKIPRPVILTDRNGRIVLVNSETERLLQVTELELLKEDLSCWIRSESEGNKVETQISQWEDRAPTTSLVIDFFADKPLGTVTLSASVFMVGSGKKRLFGFSLLNEAMPLRVEDKVVGENFA